jgi:hypothetical protein
MKQQLTLLEQYQLKLKIDQEIPHSWGCVSWNTDTRKELRITQWDLPYSADRSIVHAWYISDEADWLRQRPYILGYVDCPNCGHCWNAHSAWIADKRMICEEVIPQPTTE